VSTNENILTDIRRLKNGLRKKKTCEVSSLPLTGCNGQSVIYDGKIYFWDGDEWVTYATMGVTTIINVVTNYSALPDPTTVSGQFFFVEENQGTKWLPGSLGGTFYAKGLYYSNGVDWIYGGEFPINADQVETDAGVIVDKFISPSTLYNFVLWGTKQDNIQFQEDTVNLGTAGDVDTLDFGAGLTAVRVGNTVTVTGSSSSGETLVSTYTAGAIINGGKAVIMDTDGLVYPMDINNSAHWYQYLGVAVNAATASDPVNVVSSGKTQFLGSGWITGVGYYISATGFLSATPPAVGLTKLIGVGVDNDTINIVNNSHYVKI
jgi:hypothetical protein